MKTRLTQKQDLQTLRILKNLKIEIEKGWSGKTSNRSIKDIIDSKKTPKYNRKLKTAYCDCLLNTFFKTILVSNQSTSV